MGALMFVAGICGIIYLIMDGILKATGWKNKESRRAAETFIITGMFNKK